MTVTIIGILGIVALIGFALVLALCKAARGDEMMQTTQEREDMEREEDPYFVEIKDDE